MSSPTNGAAAAGRGVGAFVKEGGPAAMFSLLTLGIVLIIGAAVYLIPTVRADPFTGTQAKEMQANLERQLSALADTVRQHVAGNGHIVTAEMVAELRANQKNILLHLERLDRKIDGK